MKKEKMEQLIKELESKVMKAGTGGDEEQKKKFKIMQTKIQKQIKEQQSMIEEKEKRENEIIFLEQNYKSL